jgi:hypothetical protein
MQLNLNSQLSVWHELLTPKNREPIINKNLENESIWHNNGKTLVVMISGNEIVYKYCNSAHETS